MTRQKTLTVTITVDTNEEMFGIEMIEPESGLTFDYGPSPAFYHDTAQFNTAIGEEIWSWVSIMMDEEEENNED